MIELVVEVGTVAANLAQLGEKRGELAGHVMPADIMCGVENPRGLVLGIARPKIGEQAGADPLGLAHIENLAGGVHHLVHAGTVLAECAYASAKLRQVGGRQRQHLAPAVAPYDWHRWQKTVVRASIRWVSVRRVPQWTHGSPPRP